MSKRARRARHKRRKAINTAGVAESATPNLDAARRMRDEIRRARGQDLEQPSAAQLAKGTRVPFGQPPASIPPPPWKVTQ